MGFGFAFKLLPLITMAISAVETLSGKKGKEKQDAAIDLIGQFVPLAEAQVGHDLLNEAAVQDAIRKVIDAKVALMNVIRDVQARGQAPTP